MSQAGCLPKSSIVIPLKNSAEDEIIEINFDDLPEGEEVLQILKGERAALHYWLDLALEYYRAGFISDFVKILEQSGGDAGLDYQDYEKDQMRALDMLAAYYVIQGKNERTKEKRKEWFTKATLLYTTADKIIMYDQNHLLGRAYFCLLEGNKIDQADAQFNFVINQAGQAPMDSGKSIPAMMGKACIAFSKREYKTALSYYKKCLRLNHNCPADVRVGMGYCLSKMGKHDKSRLAFERALEIEPSNVAAVVALAVLDINTLAPEGIKNGIQGLSLAYQTEPENPMVLNHLANHFFYKNDLVKTEQLAWHAFQLTDNEQMRAESCYQLARCFHKRATMDKENETLTESTTANFDKAFRYYYQATQFNHPKFILPHFGLGQIYIHREEYDNAIASFEKVLKVAPNNYETLSVLGSLYNFVDQREQKAEKARELLKKVVEMSPDDIEALIELAHLQEHVDPQGSLKLYERVADLLQNKESIEIPPEIQNNIGALHFILGRTAEAKTHFESARNFVVTEIENHNDETRALLISITYNLGRANEALCQFDEAEKLYREVIKQRHNYLDCVLRLGCLSRDRGDTHTASLLFKEAMSSNPKHPDPWTLIGNMHMAKNELGPAQKKFEQILKLQSHDSYSLVALGNIWLETLYLSRTKEKDGLYRERAQLMFVKALKLRPKNIWAANGIGCLLAQRGEILEARDVFSQVREATADFPDVWINVAHIYMEQKQYVSALQMYKNCMAKFNRHNDVNLMMYIARAYWKAGKYAESRAYVENAIIEAPENLLYKFNHAVILQRMATDCLKDDKSTLAQVTKAMDDLKISEMTFKYIAETSPEVIVRFRYISRTICRDEAQACNDLLKQARTYLQRAQTKDEEERKQREKQEEERRALLKQREVEEEARREQTKRELEALKQQRQQFVEKTKEILKMPDIVPEKRGRGGGGGGGRKKKEDRDEFVNDSSDLGEYDGEGGEGRKRAKDKGSRKRRERKQRGSSDEEEAGAAQKRRTKQRREDKELDEIPKSKRGKIKSKAFLSSSEDSSDDENKAQPTSSPAASSPGEQSPGEKSPGEQSPAEKSPAEKSRAKSSDEESSS
ncbi:tetratricopeptide repeat domain-containing protein [Ditylenchus destructor]|nr:tetratricopeptide repeat domain-containing protein [Ditylenchus destructor]